MPNNTKAKWAYGILNSGVFLTGLEDALNEDSDSDTDFNFDEEAIITYYYNRGFEYNEILGFLEKHHNHCISYSTLLRRLKQYGLSRRSQPSEDLLKHVRERIKEIIDGPGSMGGYRTIWHTLEMEGIKVPRIVVQEIVKELDPEGTELRKSHCLKRREYYNPGPNYSWHVDGYDKLKPWGFPIHGCIDGFSRRIMWLKVARSNNLPEYPAIYFLDTVKELGGCPVEVVTDLGTENSLLASIQSYFRENPDAHRYVPSPRNQRIEGWWSFFSKNRSAWWRNLFQDLEAQHKIDMSSEMSKECLWYCFSKLVQEECNTVREHWNTHYIRGSRHNTVKGRPDSLYFLPEYHGATSNLLASVATNEIVCVTQEITLQEHDNEHQEYFEYVRQGLGLALPTTWKEALQCYERLIDIAENGYST